MYGFKNNWSVSVKISVRNLEPTKVKLTVTVDTEEFNPYLDAARKEIGKQVNIPGFRKGHVPGKIIDQRIGFGAVASEAVNAAVPELYSKALEEKQIHPMAQPELDVQEVPASAKDETKLKFVATVERRPDIELPELNGLEIEVAKPSVSDEDVDKRLENLRQRFGTLVGVDRPAAKGDFANIDLTATINDEAVDSQEGVSYELGSGTMLDGIDEALEGLSAGEETTFESTLQGGDHEGEKALVKVKVNSVKSEELPELNDDFAQEASEFDTLDELKADIRKQCESDLEARQATDARDAFIAKIQDGLDIPLPKGVKAEMVEQQLKNVTADPDKATDEQKKEAEETVEKELRDQMVLDALAEKMDVKVSQNEVFQFLASIAQQYGMDPNRFIQAIIQNGQIGSAVQEVGRSKGMVAGMKAVTFKDTEGNALDLSKFLGEAAEEEEEQSVEAASAAAAVADEIAKQDDEKPADAE
nr:trigger factor [Bifidobacterium vespertilionis]